MTIPPWMAWLQERHYHKAPIREAIIDIRLDPGPSMQLADLEAVCSAMDGYSLRAPIHRGEMIGRLESGKLTATAKSDQIGYRVIGGDGKHVASLQLSGFAFSRLAPYEQWDQLKAEAKKLWSLYRERVAPSKITRVGLRYINQLDLPSNLRDFRDFIRTYPEISSDLPQQLSGFFLQVQIQQPDIDAMLVLTETLIPPPAPDLVSLVIDIDLIKAVQFTEEDEVWTLLDALRIKKNLVFEGCITNMTRERIS